MRTLTRVCLYMDKETLEETKETNNGDRGGKEEPTSEGWETESLLHTLSGRWNVLPFPKSSFNKSQLYF